MEGNTSPSSEEILEKLLGSSSAKKITLEKEF